MQKALELKLHPWNSHNTNIFSDIYMVLSTLNQ